MASEDLNNFSKELKEQREKIGISLQQISQSTKIDIKFLKSIEEANFNILPEIYVKAFIKEYASCINLNPIEIIKKYEEAKLGREIIKTENQVLAEHKNEFGNKENRLANSNNEKIDNKYNFPIRINYIIGSLILLAALSIFYYSIIYTPKSEIITINNQNESNSKERFEIENKDSIRSENHNQILVKDDSLKLLLKTNADVWVKVIKDGKNVHQKMTPKDSKLQFKAKDKFSVSVGNAGVVQIFYNDNEIKNLGKYGEIKNITITPDTIKFLTIKRDDKKSN